MAAHTPGEWVVKHSESKDAWNVIGTRMGAKYKIARCPYVKLSGFENEKAEYNKRQKEEAEAIAKLIAAAPDLLEACKIASVALVAKELGEPYQKSLEILLRAIKKATT